MSKQLTPEQRLEIIDLYKSSNHTYSSLARIYDVTCQSIRQLCHKHGLLNNKSNTEKIRNPRRDFKDLTGIRLGKLICLERIVKVNKNGKNISWWKCQCDCGNQKIIALNALLATTKGSATKSCGCYLKEYIRPNTLEFGESAFNKYYNQILKAALKRKHVFNLSKEFVKNIIIKNCYYCGIKPYQKVQAHRSKSCLIYNGIDRINNKIGYIEENCVPCCGVCNKMKLALPVEIFIEKCKLISNKHV